MCEIKLDIRKAHKATGSFADFSLFLQRRGGIHLLGVERGGLGEKRQSGERGVEEGERRKEDGVDGEEGGKVGEKVRRGEGEMLKEVRTRG